VTPVFYTYFDELPGRIREMARNVRSKIRGARAVPSAPRAARPE
jgi:hypothetical protein